MEMSAIKARKAGRGQITKGFRCLLRKGATSALDRRATWCLHLRYDFLAHADKSPASGSLLLLGPLFLAPSCSPFSCGVVGRMCGTLTPQGPVTALDWHPRLALTGFQVVTENVGQISPVAAWVPHAHLLSLSYWAESQSGHPEIYEKSEGPRPTPPVEETAERPDRGLQVGPGCLT